MGCKTTDVKTIEVAKDDVSRVFDKVRTKRRKYVQEIEAMEVLKSYDSRLLNHSLQLLKMNVPNCRALHMQPK
jgi:protein tyrosine phosphatase